MHISEQRARRPEIALVLIKKTMRTWSTNLEKGRSEY